MATRAPYSLLLASVQAARWFMTSTRGLPFTTSSADLASWTAELNVLLRTVRAGLSPHLLVVRRSHLTGAGVFVPDGCTIPHGVPLVAYWGSVTTSPPASSRYLLELPAVLSGTRLTLPYVDAHLACLRGEPTPDHAALLNHGCEDTPLVAVWHRAPTSTLPIMIGVTRRSLRGGTELTYNYDSHLRSGAYTMSREEALSLPPSVPPPQPCRCAGLALCPLDRFFP
jgi:hypothetical protein